MQVLHVAPILDEAVGGLVLKVPTGRTLCGCMRVALKPVYVTPWRYTAALAGVCVG